VNKTGLPLRNRPYIRNKEKNKEMRFGTWNVRTLLQAGIEEVEEDFQAMGIRGWRKLSKERMEWKKITEKAKTHSGL